MEFGTIIASGMLAIFAAYMVAYYYIVKKDFKEAIVFTLAIVFIGNLMESSVTSFASGFSNQLIVVVGTGLLISYLLLKYMFNVKQPFEKAWKLYIAKVIVSTIISVVVLGVAFSSLSTMSII